MNQFTLKIILGLLLFSNFSLAQNYPVTTVAPAYSLFTQPYQKMNGYSISLQHEFGITRRFSLVADITFHDFKKLETFDIDTITPYIPNPNGGNGRIYSSTSVQRFLSFPFTANFYILRNKKQTISGGIGTVLQYELADKVNYSYYVANLDSTFDMGPYYRYYKNSNENGIVPDFFHITVIAKATRIITSTFGISAHFRCMMQVGGNATAKNKFYDFALGVFIKTGKSFKKK